ncbi:hypothetical protein J6590_070246 [Homalodisca vitripennis]|nr:hypothetical protein J6590_070246 [Homalodisca vitripennis]
MEPYVIGPEPAAFIILPPEPSCRIVSNDTPRCLREIDFLVSVTFSPVLVWRIIASLTSRDRDFCILSSDNVWTELLAAVV